MLMRAGDIERFVSTASPGDRETYGRGDNPPRELVRAMRPYIDAGVLSPTRKREGGGFLFMVERSRASVDLTRSPVVPRRVRRRARQIQQGPGLLPVFRMLVRAARNGLACPTNEEIAMLCGLPDKAAASYRVRRLTAAGKIRVEDRHPYGRRIVTILSGPHAGKRTVEAPI